jgi:hypothetical protein
MMKRSQVLLSNSSCGGTRWNAKLKTTAGLTHYKKITRSTGVSEYHARIELSTKVLDNAEKLEAGAYTRSLQSST